MNPNIGFLLRAVGKFLAVVVASVVVGTGLGIGLSKLSGNEGSSGPELVAAPAPRSGTTGASGDDGAKPEPKPQAPRIRVLSSTFMTTGPSGRRGRVNVRLRVTARGDETTLGTPLLISQNSEVKVDPNATDAAGDLLDPIGLGESATGDLRFVTTGALSRRLASRRRATLRIGDSSLSLRFRAPRRTPPPLTPAPADLPPVQP